MLKSNTARSTKFVAAAGIIAALYVVLSMVSMIYGGASGPIQLRLSEMLCVLAAFTPAAIPGLTLGCFISNIFAGGMLLDIIFGSLATLIGALGTHALRKHRYLCLIAPILANSIIVPFILIYAYGAEEAFLFLFLSVFAGELISCGLLGQIVYRLCYNKPL